MQRQLTNIANRVLEVRNRLKKYYLAEAGASAWENIGDLDILAHLVKLWTDSRAGAESLLGSSKVKDIAGDDLPDDAQLQAMAGALRAEHDKLGRQAKQRRQGIRKAEAKLDWERNHGRRAFQSTRINYTPPDLCTARGWERRQVRD